MDMQVIKLRALRKELQDNSKIEACAIRLGTTGDLTRMKICYLLCHYPELSVSEIAQIIDAPISTVSHSLKKLKSIHLVEDRRKAKAVFYSLSNNNFAAVIKEQLVGGYE
jgi:DNA-binding transcriptional ArsR family regulator